MALFSLVDRVNRAAKPRNNADVKEPTNLLYFRQISVIANMEMKKNDMKGPRNHVLSLILSFFRGQTQEWISTKDERLQK